MGLLYTISTFRLLAAEIIIIIMYLFAQGRHNKTLNAYLNQSNAISQSVDKLIN